MELRHSAMPDEPEQPGPSEAPGQPQPSAVSFRVDGRLTAAKIAGTVIFLLIAVAFRNDPLRSVFAGLAGVLVGVYAIRDVTAPVRLSADAEGVTLVSGFTAKRRLAWDQIERVRVERRRRLGTQSELLEVDTGDNLHLFSSYDLGVAPWEAARTLAGLSDRVDPGRGPGPAETPRVH